MCYGSDECSCHEDDGNDDWDEDEDGEEGTMDDDGEDLIDGVGFADPGGISSLRAATIDNPRDRPCPTCGVPNRLTRIDEMRGYQCNSCAERQEFGC